MTRIFCCVVLRHRKKQAVLHKKLSFNLRVNCVFEVGDWSRCQRFSICNHFFPLSLIEKVSDSIRV